MVLWCDDRSVPAGEQNLVWRAASALQTRTSQKNGANIRLEKRIPQQAGLGGGSSDAAITLIGLAHLWNVDIEPEELLEMASELGADVPFFLFGGTARGAGTGKSLTALHDAAETSLLVIKPNAGVSTSRAYERLNSRALTTSDAKSILPSSRHDGFFDNSTTDALRNDFEAVAFELEPEIERAKAALVNAGARAAMLAGSGSAVFGVFDSGGAQERAIQAIELEAGWRVFPCRTVGHDHYRSAMGLAGEIFARCFGQ